jgi:G3E family GTPase
VNPRFIMLGGFLGAGKTTTIGRLARHYTSQGRKVGIVTNDQTTDLVDTHSLRSQGFEVGEVAGACFCCHFNELTATVDRLSDQALPDVFLAEPVGSCTDLVATVIRPLLHVYQRPFAIAPYGVILKPSHGAKILRREQRGGFSPQAEYIFRKQLEEADFIIINRIDELSPTEVNELTGLVEAEYPGRTIVRMSARTGDGFAVLREVLEQQGEFGRRVMDVDYDVYAAGEAELGWLNSQVLMESQQPFALDRFLHSLIARLHERFLDANAEAAHLKVIGLSEGSYAVANLVSNTTQPELSLPSNVRVTQANVIVNARVATDPGELESFVREEIAAACAEIGAVHKIATLQSFRPGRPVPTHRITETAR